MRTITRREVLAKSTVLLLLVPVVGAAACSSSSSNPPAETNGCNGVFETSTVTDNHTHTLCVPSTDLANPPAAGVTYTTSFNADHDHTVVLTQAQLQTIENGGSVTVPTSSPAPHNFTIMKA